MNVAFKLDPCETCLACNMRWELLMSDPAIEAAVRSVPDGTFDPESCDYAATALSAAREALKPIRELHRKSRLYELAIDPTCEDQGHDLFEDGSGEWCCKQCTDASDEQIYVCAACVDMDSNSEWPCATAELIYPSEELV